MEKNYLLWSVCRFTVDCPESQDNLDKYTEEAYDSASEPHFVEWLDHLIMLSPTQEQIEDDICEMDMYNDWTDPVACARYYATWAMIEEFKNYLAEHAKKN